jgi:hypothetical protein
MANYTMRPLLALALLAAVLLSNRPAVLSSEAQPVQLATQVATTPATVQPTALVAAPVAGMTEKTTVAPEVVAPAYLALEPCSLDTHRAACEGYASELAAYGLDLEDLSQWTAFGLGRFVAAVEHLADAFGGGALREQRIARFSYALGTDQDNGRILVVWQAEPQARDGNPVRGGYAANRLYFNPNTYFLDTDTPAEAREQSPQATWWLYIHELAHLWDERSSPVTQARHSARMRQWVYAQYEAGIMDEYPSSYAVIGGPAEAFADSVAATITGDSAMRDYYGSPRDTFIKTMLCEAVGCR